MEVLLIL